VKRRDSQERDDAIAREQTESRREKLLADLKAREAADRQPPAPETSDSTEADRAPMDTDPEPAGDAAGPEGAESDAEAAE
jgi:hypothetical protein